MSEVFFVKVFKIEEPVELSFSEHAASYKYPLPVGGLQATPDSLWDPGASSASIPPGKLVLGSAVDVTNRFLTRQNRYCDV